LSSEAQAKLLRFLEEGEFYKIGGTETIKIKTRIVSATNKDLNHLMEKDLFRKDLYFRLGVVRVEVPSLNERPDDILPLAHYFLHEFARKFGKAIEGFAADAERGLVRHRWEGNVRELRNLVERGVLVAKGTHVHPQDLGLQENNATKQAHQQLSTFILPPLADGGIDLSVVRDAVERHYFQKALTIAGGNESKAAKLLNINHHTFRYRKKKLDIE